MRMLPFVGGHPLFIFIRFYKFVKKGWQGTMSSVELKTYIILILIHNVRILK